MSDNNRIVWTKVCKHCKKELPEDYFPLQARSKTGRAGICQSCSKGMLMLWQAKNRQRRALNRQRTGPKRMRGKGEAE